MSLGVDLRSQIYVSNSKYKVANSKNRQNYLLGKNLSKVSSNDYFQKNVTSMQNNSVSFTAKDFGIGKKLVKEGSESLKLLGAKKEGSSIGEKVTEKVTRLKEESIDSANSAYRKLKGKDELPFTEKPIICKSSKTTKKELDKNSEEWGFVRSNRKKNEDLIKGKGKKVDDGDIDGSGHLTEQGKDKLKHHEDFDHDETRFKGYTDDLDIVSDGAKKVAKEVGSAVAEEAVGEATMQTIERGLDCIAPGAGAALTAVRWGRRAYKAGKWFKKL